MMDNIDGDGLVAFLNAKKAHLADLEAKHEAGTTQRSYIDGAKKIIALIEKELPDLAVDLVTRRTDLQAMALTTTQRTRIRAFGQQTSFDAATSISPAKALAHYRLIYRYLLDYGPLTHEDLIDLLKQDGYTVSDSGIRARAAELKMAGWIKDSGIKGRTKAGHPAVKWRAVPEVVTTPIQQYRNGIAS